MGFGDKAIVMHLTGKFWHVYRCDYFKRQITDGKAKRTRFLGEILKCGLQDSFEDLAGCWIVGLSVFSDFCMLFSWTFFFNSNQLKKLKPSQITDSLIVFFWSKSLLLNTIYRTSFTLNFQLKFRRRQQSSRQQLKCSDLYLAQS